MLLDTNQIQQYWGILAFLGGILVTLVVTLYKLSRWAGSLVTREDQDYQVDRITSQISDLSREVKESDNRNEERFLALAQHMESLVMTDQMLADQDDELEEEIDELRQVIGGRNGNN